MGKINKYKPREEKKKVPEPNPPLPQASAQLGQGPSINSGDVGPSSSQQQQHRSQEDQRWGDQQGGGQQPRGQVQEKRRAPQQQKQSPKGQHGSFYQDAPKSGGEQHGGQKGCHQQRPQGLQGQGKGLPADSIKRGTIGKPGKVAVNYLEIDMKEMPEKAFHYDVKIQPERPKKFYRQAFEQFRLNQLGGKNVSFDGKASCYSADKLPTNSQNPEVTVTDNHGRCLRYTVEIMETADPVINLSSLNSYMSKSISDKPMREMQCLEVVLASPCHSKAIRAGRSFYPNSRVEDRMELGGGYEALVGHFQAIVLGDRPYLNVDISHKSFPMATSVLKWFQNNVLKEGIIEQKSRPFIESFLKGLNVVYNPPKSFATSSRCYKVNGLSKFPANSEKFLLDDREITVADYFKDRNYKLKFPQLHCLHVGPPAKNIMLPIELCDIEGGQVLKRKDGAAQVAKMIRFAATPTEERKAKIMKLLEFFQHNLDPTISRFGIRIANDFIVVVENTKSHSD